SRRRPSRTPRACASGRPRRAPRHHEVAQVRVASPVARRVLIVDDEAAVRMICAFNLEAAAFEVTQAVDGNQALARVLEQRPDLVLLDVMMPNRDGWTVASTLREDPGTRDLAIVFLTARVDDEDRRRAYDLGAVGYVTKPFDPLALAERLEQ